MLRNVAHDCRRVGGGGGDVNPPYLHGDMRVILLVGRHSDGIASFPTRAQVRCMVHPDDEISSRHGGQALALSSFL